jgi:hypothetical protein
VHCLGEEVLRENLSNIKYCNNANQSHAAVDTTLHLIRLLKLVMVLKTRVDDGYLIIHPAKQLALKGHPQLSASEWIMAETSNKGKL